MIAFDLGPKFSLGEIHVITGAAAKLLREDIDQVVRRHGRGDWGEVGVDGKQDNDMRGARRNNCIDLHEVRRRKILRHHRGRSICHHGSLTARILSDSAFSSLLIEVRK